MDENGRHSFELTKPLAANIDLIYMDETMRVMRSSKGTTYVVVRANPSDYSRRRAFENPERTLSDSSEEVTGAPKLPVRITSPQLRGLKQPVRRSSPVKGPPPQ